MSENSIQDLRSRVRAAMDTDRSLTQTQAARESGVSGATLSQWLKGIYAGDNEAVEAKVQRWLDTYEAQRQANQALPDPPAWVPTPSGAAMLDAMAYAQAANDIAVIYGGAGVGKTQAARHYAQTAPNVFVATMTPASASVVTCLEEICDAIGLRDISGGGAAKLHRAICKRIAGTRGMIIIDEAQHLSVQALDQIRSIHDATNLGIALVGNELVYARLTGGNRAAYLDRLFSRIGRRVRLQKARSGDVDALISAWGIEDKACRHTLQAIAATPGALRSLTKAMRLAAMTARSENRGICCDDVKGAWRELGGEA